MTRQPYDSIQLKRAAIVSQMAMSHEKQFAAATSDGLWIDEPASIVPLAVNVFHYHG